MPAQNIKKYLAVAAASAVLGLGATATAVSMSFTAASASAADTGRAPAASQITPVMRDDPHGTFDADDLQSAVVCATAIEYGLIAA